MSEENNDDSEKTPPKFALSIPKTAFGPLRKLARLDAESFEKIVAALPQAGPSLSKAKFCQLVTEKANGANASDVRVVVNEVYRMEFIRRETELSPTQLGDAIKEAIEEVDGKDLALTGQELALLTDRILALCEIRSSVRLVSKAQSALTDHEHVFLGARLYSDVRPVFNADASVIEAAVLVHDLVIHFEKNDEHQDFYVSLDESDIKTLREVLDRAERKVITMKGTLSKANVAHLTPDE